MLFAPSVRYEPARVGAMIETPAAAPHFSLYTLTLFCVGTNDLTQYTLAAARDDAASQ